MTGSRAFSGTTRTCSAPERASCSRGSTRRFWRSPSGRPQSRSPDCPSCARPASGGPSTPPTKSRPGVVLVAGDPGGYVCPGGQVELGADVLQVAGGGTGLDAEAGGDLCVGQSGGDEF